MQKLINTYCFYDGPSPWDGAPIIALSSGHGKPSINPKTGPMTQIWILRKDISPTEAVTTGQDSSTCGNCNLRPFIAKIAKAETQATIVPKCYVTVWQAPLNLWKSYQAGNIPFVEVEDLPPSINPIRQGAYGDPAMVPASIWERLEARNPHGGTSYTHQWETAPHMNKWAMASIDSATYPDTAAAREKAHALGFRTYRVIAKGEALQSGEILCPEKTSKVQCRNCKLCSGNRINAKDIAIVEIK